MVVHAHLVKVQPATSVSLWNKVLNVYGQCGYTRSLHQLFDDMPHRDIISFNTMITAYTRREHNGAEPVRFFSRMQEENIAPNLITLSTLLAACSGLATRQQIHARAIKTALNCNKFVGSSLVDGYSKCMRLGSAMKAFDDIAVLDLISWNIIIDSCVVNGNEEDALRIFSRMREEGIGFDCFTLTSILKICLDSKQLHKGMQIHTCVVKFGLDLETPVGNALITMYSKCLKGMNSAKRVFSILPQPNIISWTAMLSGFVQNGLCREAIGFYEEMVKEGIKENEFSFASILPACSSLASLEQGMQVHGRIVKTECGSDRSVGNALIDMYAKCGSLEDARQAFWTMKNRDVISWTIMITAFGQHGKGQDSLETFKEMERQGLKPDEVTFLGVLSACSYSGLVDEGLLIFRKMVNYRVKPREEHYTCVVDLLGRAGRLREAEKFIGDMGIEQDASVWEALLGACQIHGEHELGEKSAWNVMRLEPEKDGPYVVISNIYAKRGMWQHKYEVRERLDASGLRKETGHSWMGFEQQV
ncbi:pentatricopeptide repeat-containing protein At3g12770-like [Aristolochia californica]|uniref:pentatricopeptide repeat-containing protein At3g12770-like n=1 Tax=Aristolochia californica TaxID=171875 RepID=UPI0035D83CD2